MSDLVKHYQSLLKKHGPGPQAVQYTDLATQNARFEILTQIDPHLSSVIDVGCGLGDFWSFLRSKGDQSRYLGLDIVPEFIEHANSRFTDGSKAQLINSADVLPTGYNYAILSGVFNNKTEDNWNFMTKTLRSMYLASDKGIAFNAMSKFVDQKLGTQVFQYLAGIGQLYEASSQAAKTTPSYVVNLYCVSGSFSYFHDVWFLSRNVTELKRAFSLKTSGRSFWFGSRWAKKCYMVLRSVIR